MVSGWGFGESPSMLIGRKEAPLMLTHDCGSTMLALFTGEATETGRNRGWRRVAYRAGGDEFISFLVRFEASGQPIKGPVDHNLSWSVYFSDLWGNPLEVTSYDYAMVKAVLDA